MQLRHQIALVIFATATIWAASTWWGGQALSWGVLWPFSVSVTIVTAVAVLFVKYLWSWRGLRGWLVERPDLSGTWECRLRSNFKGPDDKPIEKTTYVVIRQTLVNLSFRMYTDSARSVSIAEDVSLDRTDLFRLSIVYENIPSIEHREGDSQIHYGSALFTHIDHSSTRIEGEYWTNRSTAGSLVLKNRQPQQVSSYEEAKTLFSTASSAT